MTTRIEYTNHDHDTCIHAALERAAEICYARGQRLTALRKQVLELVWHSHKPVGAYDVLAMLSKGQDRPAAPPTVYRALDFLQEQGLVHRIASLNAFIGCSCPDTPHVGIFLICEKCRTTRELAHEVGGEASLLPIQDLADSTGFQTRGALVELTGLCPACQLEKADA
ncbi:Fur family transcriptional regulator [Sansalvadorimonas verongulae]|uniref:Fur family transcriptional regulator n=1 Tax=Sansalvadorimonas verongulae TaxID=2172824 RepID=UPI002E2F9C38|nr:Fur family transcriptional regulator [Sansalvadorimonas verongulae]MTI14943.1 transcriptional repressor [Sansalvadorimonas verongulae]